MSSGGSDNQTVQQTNNPPAYVQPFLQGAATDSANLYSQGPQQYYPGETVVGFSPETEQALSGTAQRATQGSAVNQAASGLVQNTLSGAPSTGYGNANNPYAQAQNNYGSVNNPYLDETFNQAADSVQNRLSSQFAASGRNVNASRAAQADEMNNLATSIYGGAYENERNRGLSMDQQLLGIGSQGYELERDRAMTDIGQQRQQQLGMLGLAPSIANQDYVDLQYLSGVGAQREDLTARGMEDAAARWDYEQQAPGIALDQYIARLNNQPGSSMSTTSPIYRNQAAGILGGAGAGAEIGSQIGSGYSGWGAALGGLLGAFG